MTLAQTFTAAAGAVADSPKAQIIAALVGVTVAILWGVAKAAPHALAGLRSLAVEWAAKRELEALRMQRDLEKLRAEESQRIKVTLIDSVAAGLDALPPEEAAKARAAMKGATGALEPVIDREVKRRTEERAAVGPDGAPVEAPKP